MASRRMLKAAEAIREIVSMAILTEIRDPRVQNVTVTGVEVAPDMRSAKVLVSIMGDDRVQQLCLRGLANSAGFLQAKVAKRVETKYTPRLSFEIDEGVKKSLEVGRILQQIAKEREERDDPQTTDTAGDTVTRQNMTEHVDAHEFGEQDPNREPSLQDPDAIEDNP